MLSLGELADAIKSKKYSCLDVLLTYISRTIKIGHKLNYLTDINFHEAIKMAQEYDNKL